MFDECPTPWFCAGWQVFDRDGNYVAETLGGGKAELIAKTANAHDVLVAALREIADEYEAMYVSEFETSKRKAKDDPTLVAARAALALVDGPLDAPAPG